MSMRSGRSSAATSMESSCWLVLSFMWRLQGGLEDTCWCMRRCGVEGRLSLRPGRPAAVATCGCSFGDERSLFFFSLSGLPRLPTAVHGPLSLTSLSSSLSSPSLSSGPSC